MTEQLDNLVLEQPRHIRVALEGVVADLSDVTLRMSSLEEHMGSRRAPFAGLNRRMDRFDQRMTRIERRLGLLDA
jgi:archaellum component FlaC